MAPDWNDTPDPPARAGRAEDEDLFAFDEMLQGSPAAKADLVSELDAVLGDVGDARDELVQAAASAPSSRTASPKPARNVPEAPATNWRPSRAFVAFAAGIVALQIGASLLAWRSAAGTTEVLAQLGEQLAAARAPVATTPINVEPTPAQAGDEGLDTLAAARVHLERGEHERARRMCGGLLAIADRFEPARRAEIEAQAGFLIAESYRRQALLAERIGGGR